MKKAVLALAATAIVVAVLAIVFLRDLYLYAKEPASEDASPVMTDIESGQSFEEIVDVLHAKGLILRPAKFKTFARLKKYDRGIKAGLYMLSASMSPEEILKVLVKGKTHHFRLTVPEGFGISQIAETLEDAGLADPEKFLSVAQDEAFAKSLGIDADSLEGYLFPDTYFLRKGVSPERLAETMVARFRQVFDPLWETRPDGYKYSVHETVTLASIIEKETGVADERPLISSVFHNRMNRNMRLESDPTVIYGIKDFSGNLTRKDLKTPAPYNTYTIKGLPPGPIASPGLESLRAAIFPARSKYLFFVAKNDRTHHFSVDYKEHVKAVRKYQLGNGEKGQN